MDKLASRLNPGELLHLADQYIVSRPTLFNVEAAFIAPVQFGGIFNEGLRVRVTLDPRGIRRVYLDATGELISESLPGAPLSVAPHFAKSMSAWSSRGRF